MTSPHLSIVIPVFNQWPLTEQCLRSLREHTPGRFFEVIVVDNASRDETATHCKALGESLFPERFHSIPLPENLGFGRACNIGAQSAQGELLFFLNNDTQATTNWAPPLLHALKEDSKLGAVGPLLLYPGSERVQHLGVVFWPNTIKHLHELFPRSHPRTTKTRYVQALSGAALLLSRSLFWNCGGFFSGYRNGFEDLELCAHIRAQGKRLRCVTQGVIFHLTSQSQGRFDHDHVNARLLHQRCPGRFRPDALRKAKQDGYTVKLTPWLTPYIALDDKRSMELNALLQHSPSIEQLWRWLEQEPLWTDGYCSLNQALESAKRWQEAIEVQLLHTRLIPSMEGYLRLLDLAGRLGDQDLARETENALKRIAEKMNNRSDLSVHAKQAVQQCQAHQESELAAIYQEWLVKYPGTLRDV